MMCKALLMNGKFEQVILHPFLRGKDTSREIFLSNLLLISVNICHKLNNEHNFSVRRITSTLFFSGFLSLVTCSLFPFNFFYILLRKNFPVRSPSTSLFCCCLMRVSLFSRSKKVWLGKPQKKYIIFLRDFNAVG